MIVKCGLVILVKCFNNQIVQNKQVNDGQNNENTFGYSENPGYLQDGNDYSFNQNTVTNFTSSEVIPTINVGYSYGFNNEHQQQSNKLPPFHSLRSSNPSYGNTSLGGNTAIRYDEIYFNILGQLNVIIPVYTASQHRNNTITHQDICTNSGETTKHLNAEFNVNPFSPTLNQSDDSVFIKNTRAKETVKKLLHNENNIFKNEKNMLKTSNCNVEYSKDVNNYSSSSIARSLRLQICDNDEFDKEETIFQNQNQVFTSIKGSTKQLQNVIYDLNRLKTYETRFLNSKIQNESFYLSLCSDLKELTEVTEYAKNLCKKWIEREEFIEDSVDNRINYGYILRLSINIRNTIRFLKAIIDKHKLISSAELFFARSKILKNRIVKNKKFAEKIKMLKIHKILENYTLLKNENSKANPVRNVKMRDIEFLYQEKNSSSIETFKIYVEQRFHPAFFTIFEEYIFLSIYSSDQYLKIFKIDLKEKKHQEINKFIKIGEENYGKSFCFGYGSRYTIIRANSSGMLYLLKSPLKKSSEKRSDQKKFFEMMVLNKEFKMVACIQVDSIKLFDKSVRPAIFDFVIHNNFVYALDIKSKSLKIFNELLVLLKTIPIPESLKELQNIHLAVSTHYILIAVGKKIYFVKNNDQTTEFQILELTNYILNIGFYGDDLIIVRFIDRCYSFKIGENLSDMKYTHLPSLDKLKNLFLANFIIEDNFVYCICIRTNRIFRLNFTLNTSEDAMQ